MSKKDLPFVKKMMSYLWPIVILKTSSQANPYLEVAYYKGRFMLNTKRANYSYGGLHQLFQIAFKAIHFEKMSPNNLLMLGFGVGSVASIIQEEFNKKSISITGVELDPVVIELGKEYFNTQRFSNVEIICADAQTYIQQTQKKYDMIVIDIYDDVRVPEKFHTIDFLQQVHEKLNTGGIMLFNKIAYTNQFYAEFEKINEIAGKIFTRVEIVTVLGVNKVIVAHR